MKSMMWMVAVMAGAMLVAAGCQSSKSEEKVHKAAHSDDFLPDDANRTIWRTLEKQAAAGAAEDGMLYAYHFQGSELSDLGRDKLDLMVRAESRPLVVYLNVNEDDQLSSRQQAVSRFLESSGLSADAMSLKVGANPSAKTAAAPNLARMKKTENPGSLSESSDDGDNTGLDSSAASP